MFKKDLNDIVSPDEINTVASEILKLVLPAEGADPNYPDWIDFVERGSNKLAADLNLQIAQGIGEKLSIVAATMCTYPREGSRWKN